MELKQLKFANELLLKNKVILSFIRFRIFIVFYLLLTAIFASGSISAQPLVLHGSSGQEIGRYEKSSAFVVLTGQYNLPWTNVSGLKEFEKNLTGVLENLGFDVVTLIDPKGHEFHQSFLSFFNDYGRYVNSRVLVYFVGHCGGIKTKYGMSNAEYLIPSDAPNLEKNPVWFRENALSLYRLDHYLRMLGAKHVLSIFEGCSKGFALEKNTQFYMEPLAAKEFEPSREVIFINSSNKDDHRIREGLIDALKGAADLWKDGALTTMELVTHLNSGIAEGRWGQVKMVYGKLEGYALNQGTLVFPLASSKNRAMDEVEPDFQKEIEVEEPEQKAEEDQSDVYSQKGETILNWPDEVETVSSPPPITEYTIKGSNEIVTDEAPETLY
jgi:hypothetical protein